MKQKKMEPKNNNEEESNFSKIVEKKIQKAIPQNKSGEKVIDNKPKSGKGL